MNAIYFPGKKCAMFLEGTLCWLFEPLAHWLCLMLAAAENKPSAE